MHTHTNTHTYTQVVLGANEVEGCVDNTNSDKKYVHVCACMYLHVYVFMTCWEGWVKGHKKQSHSLK